MTDERHFASWKARLQRRSVLCFRMRVALFAIFAFVAAYPASAVLRVSIAVVSVTAFVIVALIHKRIDTGIIRVDTLLRVRKQQQARSELDWGGLPAAQPVEVTAWHSFAQDLDLFGEYGLHRFLDISVSFEGSRRLASWLLAEDISVEEIRKRQEAVQALAPAERFRERMLLAFSLVSREKLDGNAFLDWLRRSALPGALFWVLPVSVGLAVLTFVLFFVWDVGLLPPWFLLSLFVYLALYFRHSGIRAGFIEAAVRLDEELGKLLAVFRFLECENLAANETLSAILRPFRSHGVRPSRQIRRVRVDVTAAGLSMNPVMMVLLNVIVPWDFLFAYRLEKKRRELLAFVPVWLEAMHCLEALQSLANFSWLFPDTIFPTVHESRSDDTLFAARSLGHPLLPYKSRVRNDVHFGGSGDILLLTGSNMSGKSTLLRTIGVSAVLALAGGPVDAQSMTVERLRLFTCIHINDSLRDGVSYFYAEVQRLRHLLDLLPDTDEKRILFLIDEMFRGTNTRERHIGGKAFIRELIRRKASGAISTHDIALTDIADSVEGVRNMHFRETVINSRMSFDYLLRPGPCPTTNALTIMRLEGLPVPDIESAKNDASVMSAD